MAELGSEVRLLKSQSSASSERYSTAHVIQIFHADPLCSQYFFGLESTKCVLHMGSSKVNFPTLARQLLGLTISS